MPGVSLLVLIRLLLCAEPTPVLIDPVAVVVDDRIVTASDIALEADLSMRIPPRSSPSPCEPPPTPSSTGR